MTVGGSLKVQEVKSGTQGSFSVKFSRNTEITNFHKREMGEVGDVKATIKGGQAKTQQVFPSGLSGDLATLDLGTKRYAIFDKLRTLDGNPNDVSDKDLLAAKKLKGFAGVMDVKIDANAGITTIYCDDGAVLKFDVETDAEKSVRRKQEQVDAKAQEELKQQKMAEKARKEVELKEHCKSDFEKLMETVIGWFN